MKNSTCQSRQKYYSYYSTKSKLNYNADSQPQQSQPLKQYSYNSNLSNNINKKNIYYPNSATTSTTLAMNTTTSQIIHNNSSNLTSPPPSQISSIPLPPNNHSSHSSSSSSSNNNSFSSQKSQFIHPTAITTTHQHQHQSELLTPQEEEIELKDKDLLKTRVMEEEEEEEEIEEGEEEVEEEEEIEEGEEEEEEEGLINEDYEENQPPQSSSHSKSKGNNSKSSSSSNSSSRRYSKSSKSNYSHRHSRHSSHSRSRHSHSNHSCHSHSRSRSRSRSRSKSINKNKKSININTNIINSSSTKSIAATTAATTTDFQTNVCHTSSSSSSNDSSLYSNVNSNKNFQKSSTHSNNNNQNSLIINNSTSNKNTNNNNSSHFNNNSNSNNNDINNSFNESSNPSNYSHSHTNNNTGYNGNNLNSFSNNNNTTTYNGNNPSHYSNNNNNSSSSCNSFKTSNTLITSFKKYNSNQIPHNYSRHKINKWLYSNEELQNMKRPCRKYISYKEELIKRVKAAQFIKSACYKLELGHHVLTAATVFLHRYYVRKSIEDEKYQDIGSACIFLATKLFESKDMRKMSSIISACAKVSMKNNDYVISPSVYGTWERNIIHYEMEVLQVLCFDIELEQPSTFIQAYTKALNTSRALKKYTYCIINDSLSSTLCLRYRWDVIVVAAIYVSAKLLNETININGQKNWWSEFSINETHLKIIIKEILMNYQNEIESKINIPSNKSQVTSSSHLNSPPLSNPHPSQNQIVTTPQTLTSELEKRVSSYSSSEQGMIPMTVGGGTGKGIEGSTTTHQIPPSPTLSETGESPMKTNSRKRSFHHEENNEKITRRRINLKNYLKNSIPQPSSQQS